MAVVGAVIGTCSFLGRRSADVLVSSSNGQSEREPSRPKGRWLPSRKSASSTGRATSSLTSSNTAVTHGPMKFHFLTR